MLAWIESVKGFVAVVTIILSIASVYYGLKSKVEASERALQEMSAQVVRLQERNEALTLAVQELTITLKVKGVMAP